MAGERIESEFVVPSSTTVSAATSNQSSPVTITATPGSTFITDLLSDLQTELNADSPPSSGQWTLSLSPTTGLVTIACTDPAYIQFTSTTLRDLLGFEYNFDYPATPAQMATALGYGTWTNGAGYLCNESSGDLAPVFGSGTLNANSTPTYSNQGARGGNDKAVGFDSGLDRFDGGDIFNVTTGDLIFAWVGRQTVNTGGDVAGKDFAASGWVVYNNGGAQLRLYVRDGLGFNSNCECTHPGVGPWYVGIACIDRGAGVMRIGVQSLHTGTQSVGSTVSVASCGSLSGSASFVLGDVNGTGDANVSSLVSAAYVTVGSGVATGLSANLSTALSNFATYMKSQTATTAPSGVWYPGCPLAADSDPLQAPTGDDKAASISPTGRVYSLASSTYFRHRNVRFSHVAQNRVWANSATTTGADWETFYLETQVGQHSWFDVGSRVRVYWDRAGTVTELGSGDVDAWYMPSPTKLDDLRLAVNGWTGLVEINLGDLFTDA